MALEASWGWITLTLLVHAVATVLHRRSGSHPLLLPVATGALMVMAMLQATGTSHARYLAALGPLLFWVGPATVALAVPLWGQWARLRAIWWPVSVALGVGSLVAIASALLIAWAFGGHAQTMISLAPKSVTMPIATGLSQHFGGLVPLTAVAVALTGIAGTVLSAPLLRWALGPLDERVMGFTLGLGAHAIGTARALHMGETAGAFAAMAMGLNGLMTALWMPWAARWVLG